MHGNINPIILVYFKFEACASIKVYLNIILYYICPPQLETIDITVIRDCNPGGGGGYFKNFWGGMCRWDPGTLNLY